MVVLDTSALIYWTLDPDKLSDDAAAAIGSADRILVSSISIWEIGSKAKRGRLGLPLSIREYAERSLPLRTRCHSPAHKAPPEGRL